MRKPQSEAMKPSRWRKIALVGAASIPLQWCSAVRAQYYAYASPALQGSAIPQSTQSTFSVQADGISCSSGGGTAPSFFVGGLGGSDAQNSREISDPVAYGPSSDYFVVGNTPNNSNSGFLAAGAGFNIPLGNPSNTNVNCQAILALVESNNFLKVMKSLKDLGALDDAKASNVIAEFLRVTGKRLNVDLTSALRSDLTMDQSKVIQTRSASEKSIQKKK
jgi:hypothetical protein